MCNDTEFFEVDDPEICLICKEHYNICECYPDYDY
jgi:hypothetical protein